MNEHYFSRRGLKPAGLKQFTFAFRGSRFTWTGAGGVFAAGSFDFGTRVLVETAIDDGLPNSGVLLDLGCGTGIAGTLCALQKPGLTVVFSDVNPRAVRLARRNAVDHRIREGCFIQCYAASCFPSLFYSVVLLNPPIRAGLGTCLDMIRDSARVVRKDGVMYMVTRVRQGGKRLAGLSLQWFDHCDMIKRSKGYLVYRIAGRPGRSRRG